MSALFYFLYTTIQYTHFRFGCHLIHLFILHAVSCTVIQVFIRNIRITISHQNNRILRIQHCNDRSALIDNVQDLFCRTSGQVIGSTIILHILQNINWLLLVFKTVLDCI